MRNLIIGVILGLHSFMLFGQQVFESNRTPLHKEVRGTKISMISPLGFLPASNFKGFEQTEINASIMILDIDKPFAETIKGLTTESLSRQGLKVAAIEKIIFNKLPALLITAEQILDEILFTKYILVIGTDKETILINGLSPPDDAAVKTAIKNALLSTIYDAEKVIMPLDAVDFAIKVSTSGLKLAKISPNMLIFNRDGKIPTASMDKTSMVVAKTFSKMAIEDKKSFALNKIRTLPIQINKIISTAPITIDNLTGYEVVGQGQNRKTGLPEQVYQVILFSTEGYYIIYGSSESNFKTNLSSFKKTALTFKLK